MTFLKKIWHALHFGLILNELRYKLRSIGIEVSPFYWTEECISNYKPPMPKNGLKGYSFYFFGPEEIKEIVKLNKYHKEDNLLSRLSEGKICYGVTYNEQIAGFNWVDLNECNYKGNKHQLDDDEAYLFDGNTMKDFRGLNLAPCLRFKSYDVLKKMDKKRFFSVTQVTNTPAIKFKRKLDAKFLWLGLYIELFKKIHWSFIIKKYSS